MKRSRSKLARARSPNEIRPATKLTYGLGLAAEGIKNNAFSLFLLFYYQQVIGLNATACGVALLIALAVDAVTDPLVGVWSDGFKSRLGRRHPFMYAGSIPMALCYYAVFAPPDGLGQTGLFLWLTGFAIGTRFAMTLFMIPHLSLVPELTDDYDERTSLMSVRSLFAWMFGITNAILGYAVFMAATEEYPMGLLNPDGYPRFALCGAIVILVSSFACSVGTQKVALASQREGLVVETIPARQLPHEMALALRNPSYRAAVVGGLFLWVGFGVQETLGNYINTYFWGLGSEQIALFALVLVVAVAVVVTLAKRLGRRFGKRNVAVAGAVLTGTIGPTMILCRLLGVLPPNGHPALLPILMSGFFFVYSGIVMSMLMLGALIADVTDEHELTTGKRQEGLLFSASAFFIKAASGIGVLLASQIVRLANIPTGADRASVDPDVIRALGIFAMAAALFFGAGVVLSFKRYTLSRAAHTDVLAKLEGARQEGRLPEKH